MSTADTKTGIEETFATKLGIEMVTPKVFEELIELHAGTRVVVTAVGASGIGKTAIPKQVAAKRNGGDGVPYVALHMPTMTLEDFHIPTLAPDARLYYDRRISRRFQPLLEHVAKVRKDLKLKPTDPFPSELSPILAVEELNRAVDKSVSRAAFTLLDDRMVGDIVLDDGIQIVVTMNPSGGGMNVNEFERDPAMRRRLLPIGITCNYGDFIKHAQAAKFHSYVIDHLGAHPSYLYDEGAAGAGKVFACPATWENVSRICYRFESVGMPLISTAGRAAIAGAIGTASATTFLDFVRDNTLVVTPEDVLTAYGPETEARKRFKAYLTQDGGRLDKVTELATGVAIKVFVNLERKPETITKSLANFIGDLPEEIMMSFIQRLVDESQRLGNDAKSYLQTLNQKLAQEAAFTDGLARLHKAKQAAQKEAQSAG
jgi:hypothetical protein